MVRLKKKSMIFVLFLSQTLDYKEIYQKMLKPAHVFDGRLILDHSRLMDLGFHVEAIGKRLTRPSLHRGFANSLP